MEPADAVAAVTHDDPYPYYAALATQPGLQFDPRLDLWVAASAAAVTEVLCHADCRVRPLHEPVPGAIAGGAAGPVFGDLARMNEGSRHALPRLALQRALGALDPVLARARTRALARRLWREGELDAWMFEVPVSVLASLMGFPYHQLAPVAAWMRQFVACLSPLSSAEQIASAHGAARALLDSLRMLVRAAPALPDSLLAQVIAAAAAVGWDDADALLANLVGLLSQTYAATAGLIGNSIVALARAPEQCRASMPYRQCDAEALVCSVSRNDPPVQNTLRFVARDAVVAGTPVQAGQKILVLLAAANRDPQAQARAFGFGHGAHACPGHALACTIAAAAVEELMELAAPYGWLGQLRWTYWRSLNARIPVFTQAMTA